MDEELAFHVAERTRANIEKGMDPLSARAAALRRLGDLERVAEHCARLLGEERLLESRRNWWSDLGQDIRHGARSAVRSPLFSFFVLVTLALGIGANSAVFGVVKSVLLDALPFRDASQLVRVYGDFLDGSNARGPLSAGTVRDIAERQRSFSELGAFVSNSPQATYAGEDGPEVVSVVWIEPRLLRTLGVNPVLGRSLIDEDAVPDTAVVVMLTHATWQQRFGADPGVVGRSVRISDMPLTVVGVLPPGFVSPGDRADFYFPLNLEPVLRDPISARGSHWLGLVGRLKPGVSLEAAQLEMSGIGADLAREHPRANSSIRLATVPLRTAMVGETRAPLLVLMASACLVLFIACANLAAALVSRTISRRREFAVRISLGAGRGRLVRQLLTETCLLALVGGVGGLLLATLGLRALQGLAVAALPPYADMALDTGAVLATFGLAVMTGLAFGLAPAVAVNRSHLQGVLREESRGVSEGRRARILRGTLVAVQVALCLSLLAGAGLLARSLWAMSSTPLGFDPEGVLSVTVQISEQRYGSAESLTRFRDQFTARLEALPGVTRVAVSTFLPTRVLSRNGFSIDGAPWATGDAVPFVLTEGVSEDYFETLRIPLRRGRTFMRTDRPESLPVIVINESMSRRYWPGGDAIGARIRMGPNPNAPLREIVGIVGDVRTDPSQPSAEPLVYAPLRQGWWGSTFLLRTSGAPRALVPAIRRELADLDETLALDNVTTLRAAVAEDLAGRRLPVVLMAGFGILALLLAAVGVYAMFAHMAAAREREFGVRMALGSSRRAIAGLVLRQGGKWMAAGMVGGALGIALVTRLLRNLLFGTGGVDALALGFAVLLLGSCATVALLVPVRRATRINPAGVMR